MFTQSELKRGGLAGNGGGFSSSSSAASSFSSADSDQELGPLGLNSVDFKRMIGLLNNRTKSIHLEEGEDNQLRNLFGSNPSQKSLQKFLGKPKKNGPPGSANDGLNQQGEAKKQSNGTRNNLLNKIQNEEQAIAGALSVLADTGASSDNPLGNDPEAAPSAAPWTPLTEKNLEYIFREAVVVEHKEAGRGRFLNKMDPGTNPHVLSVRIYTRILQAMGLNFPWFINRLFRMMCDLGVETMTSTNAVIYSDANTNSWNLMDVNHFVTDKEKLKAAVGFLEREYPKVHKRMDGASSPPTCLMVEFELVDSSVGMADSDQEHQGSAYIEWKCFNSRKNLDGSGTGGVFGRLDGPVSGLGPFSSLTTTPAAASSSSFSSASPFSSNGGTGGYGIFPDTPAAGSDIFATPAASVGQGGSSWIDSISSAPLSLDFANPSGDTHEKFRHGAATVKVAQNSPVTLTSLPKGNENRQLMVYMVNFIEEILGEIEDANMHERDHVLEKSQLELYNSHKDVFMAAVCSSPASLYRTVCELFANLVMPKLRNHRSDNMETSVPMPGVGAKGANRTKVYIEYGSDMQYDTTQYAKGKMRISNKRICECKKVCNDTKCFDAARQSNVPPRFRAEFTDEIDQRRYHNIHRNSEYDFRFFDRFEMQFKKKKIENPTTDHSLLLQDKTAFDLLTRCFSSAGLHHIFCNDVFMLHRGPSFNINLENNKIEASSDLGGVEETSSFQTVDSKAALDDITSNKLRRGSVIIDYVKKSGMSFREFSEKVSRLITQFNYLTTSLCKECAVQENKVNNIVTYIIAYVSCVIPLLNLLAVFVDNRELDQHLQACNKISDDKSKKWHIYFRLFKFLIKFINRNYNAAVTSGINRRGYLSTVSKITGYRYESEGTNTIRYHETTASVSSCISFCDYYSNRTSDRTSGKFEEDVLNHTASNLMEQFSSNLPDKDITELFCEAFKGEIFGDENDDEDEHDNDEDDAAGNEGGSRTWEKEGASRAPHEERGIAIEKQAENRSDVNENGVEGGSGDGSEHAKASRKAEVAISIVNNAVINGAGDTAEKDSENRKQNKERSMGEVAANESVQEERSSKRKKEGGSTKSSKRIKKEEQISEDEDDNIF